MAFVRRIEDLKPLFQGADHYDVKVVDGKVSLREFIFSMFSYNPIWLRFLFVIRLLFAYILGLKHTVITKQSILQPADVPTVQGESIGFFTVHMFKENNYWITKPPKDKHLDAYLGVIVEQMDNNLKRFYVLTVVHYKHWTGKVYFNLIRPFHHLVVWKMARAGLSNHT